MQVLYLIIFWSINDTNLDEKKKTEVNHRQQTIQKLTYRNLSLSRKHESVWILIPRNDAFAINFSLG